MVINILCKLLNNMWGKILFCYNFIFVIGLNEKERFLTCQNKGSSSIICDINCDIQLKQLVIKLLTLFVYHCPF